MLVFCCSYAVAHDKYFPTQSTITELLPTDGATDLMVDRRGFLWIRTAAGVHRFNGYKVETHYYRSKPPDKRTNAVSLERLIEDRGS